MDNTTVLKRLGRKGPKSSPRGMTLIELLIVVAISAIILIALLSLYMAGQKYFYNQNSRADTIEDSRMPMAWISRDARGADSIRNEGTTLTVYDGTTYTTGVNCLVLEMTSIDGAGNLLGTTDYVVYSLDGTRLIRVLDADDASARQDARRVMADGVAAFSLRYFDDNMTEVTSGYDGAFVVEIELTSQGHAIQRGGQPFQETVRTQAKLRNKVT